MNYTIEQRDNIVIFTVKNTNLDSSVSAQFKAEILIVAQPTIKGLIIELSNVEYVDSSGLGAILLAHRQLSDHGIPVLLIAVQPTVKKMLSISHLEQIFEFFDSVDEAVESFADSDN
jgi:anti-sigma B factor antagonist